MKFARSSKHLASARALLFTTTVILAPAAGAAHETGSAPLHFQKPSGGNSAAAPAPSNSTLQFRGSTAAKPEVAATAAAQPAKIAAKPAAKPVEQATYQEVAKPLTVKPQAVK